MGGENKFFFEEDSEAPSDATLNAEEQANIFGTVLAEAGISSNLESMAPMGVVAGRNELQKIDNKLLTMEYGIVNDDYTLHITPTHNKRNLTSPKKYKEAMIATIELMNTKVPIDLRVAIHPPRNDWEVKMISFVIEGGAEAWNFDKTDFETNVIPLIFKKLTDICMVL